MTFTGKLHVCDGCGEVIEKTGGYDWMGPNPEPGQPQRHYHISRDFPACRVLSGADGENGLLLRRGPAQLDLNEIENRVMLALARRYTVPGREGKGPGQRLDQEMMAHFTAEDGGPAMSPVTPREAARVVTNVLWAMTGMP
jgi:hypothetical protein